MAGRPSFVPLYYAPDLDPSWEVNPGVLVGCSNYVPTKRGGFANFCNGPNEELISGLSWILATYGTPITGYIFKTVAGGTARMFHCTVGAHRRLLEVNNIGTVTDRSLGAADYNASAANWTMAAAGNAILAANGVDQMQVSTGAAFSNLGGGSPTGALCLCTNLGFVLAGYNGDGSNADSWGCSALGNYASWTPSLATQAANGRLLDTPGPIRAMVPLRDAVIAYKDDSIYIGEYIGDTVNGVIWGWRLISDRVGCSSPHGVGVLNNVHYFLHKTGVYAFDGTQVSNVGNQVQKELLRQIGDFSYLKYAATGIDELEGVVYFCYPVSGNSTLTTALLLNVNTGKYASIGNGSLWQGTNASQACYGVMHCTISDLVQWNGTWPSTQVANSGYPPVFLGTEDGTNAMVHAPQTNRAVANDPSADAQLTTGYVKTGPGLARIGSVTPRFMYLSSTQQATPSMTYYSMRNEGDTASLPPAYGLGAIVANAASWNAKDERFDVGGAGTANRVLQCKISLRGAHEIAGAWIDIESAGIE